MEYNIIILLILIIFSAFFSSAEVIFLSLNDAKITAMMKAKKKNTHLIKKLKAEPRSLLISILIGNNLANISAASLATVIFSYYFDSAVIGITTGVMTIVVLIVGEIIPKSFASANAVVLSQIFAPPVMFFKKIFTPIIVVMEKITSILIGDHKMEKVSEDELEALAMTGVEQGTIEKSEGAMIEKLFNLNDITAEDIMTPRVELVYVLKDDSVEDCAVKIEKHGITRCLVADVNPDKIEGFIHAQDVLLAFREGKEKEKVSSLIRPIVFVPRQMIISNILKEFQKRKTHIAVVLDEYGGTDGVITLEDIIEELVGEIVDEHDIDEYSIKRIGKTEIIVAGAAEVRDVNRFFNINFSDDELDTVADIILRNIKKIPKQGMKVDIKGYQCIIEKVENKIIKLVRIIK
jgi:putative hemolysin